MKAEDVEDEDAGEQIVAEAVARSMTISHTVPPLVILVEGTSEVAVVVVAVAGVEGALIKAPLSIRELPSPTHQRFK